jgi:ubiquinone/menaquinone biosynthesis C-methylase UbiE
VLTLFPRPKPSAPKPLEPESQSAVPAPLEMAAETSEAQIPVGESAFEPVIIDEPAATPEPIATEEIVAAEDPVAPEVSSAVEESVLAEPPVADPAAHEPPAVGSPADEGPAAEIGSAEIHVTDAGKLGITALSPREIDDIVAEISARIHSLEPEAGDLPPAGITSTVAVGVATAEDDSELIEWETVEPFSSETAVTTVVVEEGPEEATPESLVTELSSGELIVADDIGAPVELGVQYAAPLDDVSADPSVDDAELIEPTASEAATETTKEEAPALEGSATEVDQVLSTFETQLSPADTPIAAQDLHDDPAHVAEVSVEADESALEGAVAPTDAITAVESVEHAGDSREKSVSADSGLLNLPRVAEPEVMDDAVEVEAYASAAAQEWLSAIDASFIEHAARLVKERQRGRALDIGTGPGQITLKLALRLSLWKFIGVDRSQKMIDEALANMAATAPVTGRLEFQMADGNRLDYPDASFDLVVCNSVLHHFVEPQNLLAEMARVVKPRGAILLRDLRRPSRLKYPLHVRWHGRRYTGTMNKLYRDSVRAAYTVPELQRLLAASPLRGARVFKHGSTHIGIERVYNW